jgi:hypothetical protein
MKANFIFKTIIIFLLFIFTIGCSNRIDRSKFDRLYRSAKSIEGALSIGVTYPKFAELLQNYGTEILIMKNEDMTPEELKLFNFYVEALGIFSDSLSIWKNSLENIKYDWIPKGRIFVGSELIPIVEKYKIPTEDHEYPKRNKWKTISKNSMQILWAKAGLKLEEADKLITSNKEVSLMQIIESKILGQ